MCRTLFATALASPRSVRCYGRFSRLGPPALAQILEQFGAANLLALSTASSLTAWFSHTPRDQKYHALVFQWISFISFCLFYFSGYSVAEKDDSPPPPSPRWLGLDSLKIISFVTTSLKYIGIGVQRSIRSAFEQSTGSNVSGHYKHYFFFSVSTFSHRRSSRLKRIYFVKFDGSSQKSWGIHLSRHCRPSWGPLVPIWIHQTVRHCRRWASASGAARLVYWHIILIFK